MDLIDSLLATIAAVSIVFTFHQWIFGWFFFLLKDKKRFKKKLREHLPEAFYYLFLASTYFILFIFLAMATFGVFMKGIYWFSLYYVVFLADVIILASLKPKTIKKVKIEFVDEIPDLLFPKKELNLLFNTGWLLILGSISFIFLVLKVGLS